MWVSINALLLFDFKAYEFDIKKMNEEDAGFGFPSDEFEVSLAKYIIVDTRHNSSLVHSTQMVLMAVKEDLTSAFFDKESIFSLLRTILVRKNKAIVFVAIFIFFV